MKNGKTNKDKDSREGVGRGIPRRWIIPGSIIGFLVAALVVESVLLVRMSDRVDVLSGSSGREGERVDRQQSSEKPLLPDLKLDDDWFGRPFDRDKWDPFEEMQQMQDHMNRMFDDAFGRFGSSRRFGGLAREHSFSPRVDVDEEADRFVIRVDLPGVDEASINVKVIDEQMVKITGTREKKVEESDDDGNVVRQERRMGQFERSLSLPSPVDGGGMQIERKDGVFTIYLPKKPKEAS